MLKHVQNRIVMLIFALTAITAGVLIVSRVLKTRQAEVIARGEAESKRLLFDRIVELTGAPLSLVAHDYTMWDDMVTFVETRDPAWAAVNLETTLETYSIHAMWVLLPDMTAVYYFDDKGNRDLRPPPWPRDAYKTLFARGYLVHFFTDSESGLLEIRGAPVQPSDDTERRTTPRGYLFVAQKWDAAWLDRLSELSQAKVSLVPVDGLPAPPEGEFAISFARALPGWTGEPLRLARVTASSTLGREIAGSARWETAFLILGAILSVLISAVLLHLWINRPLRTLSRSLHRRDPKALDSLSGNTTEFGELGALLRDYFTQKESLEREVDERKRLEEQLRHMAHHDKLTGLPNRALLEDRVAIALARAQRYKERLALMMLDLDGFKQVNDTCGHDCGDRLLQDVAERLLKLVRKSDSVARLGGDEFVLVLPEVCGREGAEVVAKRVVESLARPFVGEKGEMKVGVSVGISVFPDDGTDADALLKKADVALYRAKGDGRGRYVFYAAGMD